MKAPEIRAALEEGRVHAHRAARGNVVRLTVDDLDGPEIARFATEDALEALTGYLTPYHFNSAMMDRRNGVGK